MGFQRERHHSKSSLINKLLQRFLNTSFDLRINYVYTFLMVRQVLWWTKAAWFGPSQQSMLHHEELSSCFTDPEQNDWFYKALEESQITSTEGLLRDVERNVEWTELKVWPSCLCAHEIIFYAWETPSPSERISTKCHGDTTALTTGTS